jgi:multicomponent K+:H+ antiporter subunit A
MPTLLLVLLGAFTKSAQFPFHFWLPHAMAAPTPVSAYLHSATMVKAGVFLLARLFPALSGNPEWTWLVGGVGLATLLVGAVIALFKHDLKGLLAYSTISHLGLITALFGIGTPLAAVAGVFHIINHAIFKAGLFMAAGIIDHECGTRDMRRINGMWKAMPHTATLAMVAAAAMAGVPLANGFLSKEMFFAEAVTAEWPAALRLAAAGACDRWPACLRWPTRCASSTTCSSTTSRRPAADAARATALDEGAGRNPCCALPAGRHLSRTDRCAPAHVAAAAVLQGPLPEHNLALWHGVNPALWMSVIALAGGVLLYFGRKPLFTLHDRLEGRLDARAIFERLLEGPARRAPLHRRCRHRLAAAPGGTVHRQRTGAWRQRLVAGTVATERHAGAVAGGWRQFDGGAGAGVRHACATGIAPPAADGADPDRSRRAGRGAGLRQVLAPDLALTQLSVEVVTIILLLLALYFLPQETPAEPSASRRWRDGAIALVAGGGATMLAWAVLTRPVDSICWLVPRKQRDGWRRQQRGQRHPRRFPRLRYLRRNHRAGDRRAGHLCAARKSAPAGPAHDAQGRAWDADLHPLIMATFARLLLPLALLVSAFILLRGHNLPGGGFIAGLITAIALIMQYLANGVAGRTPACRRRPIR